jgi:uncharacterized cupin superfamily protein
MKEKPVIALSSLQPEPRPTDWLPPGTVKRAFDVRRARAAPLLGLSKLGCTLHVVGPGATAYPFHSHRINEELLIVLEGQAELRYGSERLAARAGDLIGCPTGGPETAHQLINTGSAPLKYLAISTMIDPDICDYPDSGKLGVWAGDYAYLTHADQPLGYWDGE